MTAVLATAVIAVLSLYSINWLNKFALEFFQGAIADFRTKQIAEGLWKLYFAVCLYVGIVLLVAFALAIIELF